MSEADPLLSPFQLKHLTLKNRVMSTSHACGLEEEDGMPAETYQRYHEEKARGGLALTAFRRCHARADGEGFLYVRQQVEAILRAYRLFGCRATIERKIGYEAVRHAAEELGRLVAVHVAL